MIDLVTSEHSLGTFDTEDTYSVWFQVYFRLAHVDAESPVHLDAEKQGVALVPCLVLLLAPTLPDPCVTG